MIGVEAVKAERYPPPRDASLQRLRDIKQTMAQKRLAAVPRPQQFPVPKTTPLPFEPIAQAEETVSFTVTQEEVNSESFSAPLVQEEPLLASAPPVPVDPPTPDRKKKDLEDTVRRVILAETDLQNGTVHAERLKVQLLEEDNERLRAELKQAQRVGDRQSVQGSEAGQSEITRLNALLEDRSHEVSLLTSELTKSRSEKSKLKDTLESYVQQLSRYKESSEAHIKVLEHEKEALQDRLRKARSDQSGRSDDKFQEYAKDKENLLKQLSEARETIDDLRQSLGDREERILALEREMNEGLLEENQKLLGALPHGSIPEPPPEHFSPILDIHPPGGHKPRALVADVGSTGTSAIRHHTEEYKELSHYASPAPQETHYQSTGETLHDPRLYDTGAATPPMEQPWVETSVHSHTNSESRTPPITQRSLDVDPQFSSSEEEKDQSLGTPKRDEALSGHDSGSSTPPRQRFGGEKSNTPQPQQTTNQRVHNLTQPNYPMHYSIPAPMADLSRPSDLEAEDFFTQLQHEARRQ